MHKADLTHPNRNLQEKLERLYGLNRHTKIDLGFRPPYVELLRQLGNPHFNLPPVIHVAGTNGKGSVVAMLRAMLEAGGYSVHVYTSPHLVRFNERIVLAGSEIKDDLLESLIDEAVQLNQGAEITFFEITTAIAFAAFSRIKADIVLLEVGLGGRLDSTNIIPKPIVSVINKLSLDHTEFLGSTYTDIAREKAGIMKYDTPCIVGTQTPEGLESGVLYKLEEESVHKKTTLFCANKEWFCEAQSKTTMQFRFQNASPEVYPRPNLVGDHQIDNAGAALAALEVIKDHFPLTHADKTKGLQTIRWPGRLQQIQGRTPEGWELWVDGGHNDSAGAALGKQAGIWGAQDGKPLHLICGMKGDKDIGAFLNPLIPFITSFTATRPEGVGVCISPDQMTSHLNQSCTTIYGETQDFTRAIERITQDHPQPGRILICGSLYLVQKVLT